MLKLKAICYWRKVCCQNLLTWVQQGLIKVLQEECLARFYLDWAGYPVKDTGKYAQAASSAKSVIDNAGAHGFALVPDMGNLFTEAGRFNRESMFTIAYCASCGLPNRKMGKLGLTR